MYREVFVPVDNSQHADWAVDRAIELCAASDGRITGNHVYAARLHDVRFRQLETGLPAQFQTPKEIKRQRKVHDKLIEKGLQLISDSFLDQVENRCAKSSIPLRRQLLEGINYEEIVKEVNSGAGQLPSLIGFDANIASRYDGGETVRGDVRLDADGRIVGEEEDLADKLAGTSGRDYDLVILGAHGIGRQPYSQLGGVVARVARGVQRDTLIVRDDRTLRPDVRCDPLRLQRVRRRIPPRGLQQHQRRPLSPRLEGIQVRGAGGAAQQHHRQGPPQALAGAPQAR